MLSEDDIPGASLQEPLESRTISELRWWLLCHGIVAPNSWKKGQCIARYYKLHILSKKIIKLAFSTSQST